VYDIAQTLLPPGPQTDVVVGGEATAHDPIDRWRCGSLQRHQGMGARNRQLASRTSRRAFRPIAGIRYQEQIMSVNKDQVEGRVKEAKGKIKEVAGHLVGNEKMEVKGKIQKTLGQAQAKFGDVKQDVKDAKNSA
jgi:uncharacterized protein YjbJ (UPF0337 family)